jgi:hypothetical protein
LGSNYRSAIATLVERQARYTMLVHLPQGHGAIAVRDGLEAASKTLPEHLRKSLTWDQGTELAQHRQITLATKMAIYFCDPHSPWQPAPTKTPTGCCGSTFRRAPTCPSTLPIDCSRSPPSSTLDLARPSLASPPPKPCNSYCLTPNRPSLRRPPEFADPAAGRSTRGWPRGSRPLRCFGCDQRTAGAGRQGRTGR